MTEERTEQPTTRRAVLAAGGALVATLAGCADQPGETTTATTARPTTTELSYTCGQVDGKFVEYETGAKPMIFDFDYPSAFADRLVYHDPSTVNGRRELADDAFLSFTLDQDYPTDSPPDQDRLAEHSNRRFTMSFDGRRTPVWEPKEANTRTEGAATFFAHVPYDVVGFTQYFRTTARMYDSTARGDGRLSDECARSIRTAARRVVESLRVNPENTVDA